MSDFWNDISQCSDFGDRFPVVYGTISDESSGQAEVRYRGNRLMASGRGWWALRMVKNRAAARRWLKRAIMLRYALAIPAADDPVRYKWNPPDLQMSARWMKDRRKLEERRLSKGRKKARRRARWKARYALVCYRLIQWQHAWRAFQ